jgi:hypothetical protein
VRREVKKRDKGICRLCGLNVVMAHRTSARAMPPASDLCGPQRVARRPRRAGRRILPQVDRRLEFDRGDLGRRGNSLILQRTEDVTPESNLQANSPFRRDRGAEAVTTFGAASDGYAVLRPELVTGGGQTCR